MLNQSLRLGKFTSSDICRLIPTLNKDGSVSKRSWDSIDGYCYEKLIEKRIGRTLNSVSSTRPLIWGRTLEPFVVAKLGAESEYEYKSDETITHPIYEFWAGTPDLLAKEKVGDIKCFYTVKTFAQFSDICLSGSVEAVKKDFPAYYWQLVSNAIITGKKQAELIGYCPYQSDLEKIREYVSSLEDYGDQHEAAWIYFAKDEALPYIMDAGYYQDINSILWEVSEEDKQVLTNAVLMASEKIK